jgi:hypothetical protein
VIKESYVMLCSQRKSADILEIACSPEMLVDFLWAMLCYIPEDRPVYYKLVSY